MTMQKHHCHRLSFSVVPRLLSLFVLTICSLSGFSQLSGIKTIPGDFSSFASAVGSLNSAGVAIGGVEIRIAAGYVEQNVQNLVIDPVVNRPSQLRPVVFKKHGVGNDPLFVSGTGSLTVFEFMIKLKGVEYVTFDGISLQENPANVNNSNWVDVGFWLDVSNGAIGERSGCKYNTIKNCNISLHRANGNSVGIYMNINTGYYNVEYLYDRLGHSYNQFLSNRIEDVARGYAFRTPTVSALRAVCIGNRIDKDPSSGKPSVITNFSAPWLYSCGIEIQGMDQTVIANTRIDSRGNTPTNRSLFGIKISGTQGYSTEIHHDTVTVNAGLQPDTVTAIAYVAGGASNGSMLHIHNNQIKDSHYNSGSNLLLLGGAVSKVLIENNRFTNNGDSISSVGATRVMWLLSTADEVHVVGNEVDHNYYGSDFSGISLNPKLGYAEVRNNHIHHNSPSFGASGYFSGIAISDITVYYHYTRAIIKGNKIADNGGATYSAGVRLMDNTPSMKGEILIDSNQISNLAGHQVTGILMGKVSVVEASRNQIYGLKGTSEITGIKATGDGTYVIHDNYVHGLDASGATSIVAMSGMYFDGGPGMTTKTYQNTIYLNSPPNGLPIQSTVIKYWGGYATSHYLSGNILVNQTNPVSSPGFTNVIYASNLNDLKFNPLSGGNCLYASPSGFVTRLISVLNGGAYQTIDQYRALLSPAEENSFVELPPFVNNTVVPYDLHLLTAVPTRCEQGSLNRSDAERDSDGDIRQGYPGYVQPTAGGRACDVGADEFTGMPLNGTPPRMQFEPLAKGLVGASRALSNWATIEDPEGIDISPGNLPRLYYKRSSDQDTLAGNTSLHPGWKYVEATVTGNLYSFTLDYTRLLGGSVTAGTEMKYFVVAQDLGSPRMVEVNTATLATAPSSVQLTSANFPASGQIRSFILSSSGLSGTVLVGTGQTYTSLTNPGGVFALVNSSVLTGDVEIKVTSDLLNEHGLVDLAPWAENGMEGIHHVRISPDAAVVRRIQGKDLLGALLNFEHVDRVILDGTVNGQRGYLLLRNKQWTQPVIHVANGAQDIRITGCILENVVAPISVPTDPVCLLVDHSEAPQSLHDRGCDRLMIDHNEFRQRTDTVVVNGAAIPAIQIREHPNEGYLHDSLVVSNNYFTSLQCVSTTYELAPINVLARCNEMRIDSNHFYIPQSSPSVIMHQYQFIAVNAPEGAVQGRMHIGENYFGGSQPYCQGSVMPSLNMDCRYFQGIGVSFPNAVVTIENNHFENLKLNVTDFGNLHTYNLPNFALIHARWGDFLIRNNQIGSSGATGALRIKWNQIGDDKAIHGIVLGDSTSGGSSGIIEGNHIMNVQAYDSSVFSPRNIGGWISAYSTWHGGEMVVRDNQIGDTLGVNPVSFWGGRSNLYGLHLGSRTSKIRASGNLLGNVHLYANLVETYVVQAGLTSGTCGTVELVDNHIESRGQVSPNATLGQSRHGYTGAIRFYSKGEDNVVAGNRIRLSARDIQGRQHGLWVNGILVQSPHGGSGKVFGNAIDGAGLRFGQANGIFAGIKLKNANDWLIHSNTVAVGDSGTLHPTTVVGIMDSVGLGPVLIANNTVLMGGDLVSSATTSAYMKMGVGSSTLRNNLLINAIPAGAASSDYAISVALSDPTAYWVATSANYNLYVTGDSSVVAKLGTTGNAMGFAAWKTSAMSDRESYSATTTTVPLATLFVNHLQKNFHINANNPACWYVNGKGIAGAESGFELNDMDVDSARSVTLGVPVDIGADEFTPTVGVLPPTCKPSGPAVPGTTTSYLFAGRPIGEITWPQGANVPQNVQWRYYSSVPPIGTGGQDINSYWKLNFGGMTGWNCGIRYYYSIHEQAGLSDQALNLGQRVAPGPWYYHTGPIGQNSGGKYFDKPALNTIDEFTLGIQSPSNPYLITTTVTSGQGSALPSNSVSVVALADQTISFAGNGCFWVDSVFVDGNYVGNPTSYTFTSVSSNHQVQVKFRHAFLPPVVTIAQTSGSYCPNSPISLNATTFLGGPAPVFQWYANGIPVGTNSPVLTGSFPNGAAIRCIMTSNDSCAAWPMDTSNVHIVSQVDLVAPTAVCNPYSLQLGSQGTATLLPANVAAGSSDLCGIATTTLSQTAFDCSDVGVQNVTVTVQDSSGNTSTCVAAVTVLANPMATTIAPVTNVCGRHISCYGGHDGSATAQGSGGCPPYTYVWSNGANTATVSNLSAGTYTVTAMDAVGGTSTAFTTLQQPNQLFLFLTSADSSCTGDSTGSIVVFVNHGNNCQPYNFQWTSPNGFQSTQQNLTGIGPGTYDLLVSDVLGCSDSMAVPVGSIPSPQPVITQNGAVLSTSPGYSSYQWLFFGIPIPGANASSHTTTSLGEYQVEVTGSNGCIGRSTVYLLVGAGDPEPDLNGIDLYPNPANGTVSLISAKGIRGVVKVEMRNPLGQLVGSYEVPDLLAPRWLDISRLSAGCYTVLIRDEKQARKTLKLVVQ